MQIQIEKALDVEKIEGTLAQLWRESSTTAGEDAVLRARVANLMVYTARESTLTETSELIRELTAMHPSRVVLMEGARDATDRDIELHVNAFCQEEKRTGAKRLSCEQVSLRAQGKYVSEIPSAAVPLLVSDLSTFLWWRDVMKTSDEVFQELLEAADRLIIDSDEFENSRSELLEVDKLPSSTRSRIDISDLNWARLTFWRELTADFYDVPTCRPILDNLNHVRIEYVAPANEPEGVAPQAGLFAGWLASRLGWNFLEKESSRQKDRLLVRFAGRQGREIAVELRRVERAGRKPGRLAEVELKSDQPHGASFKIVRSADNLHLSTEANVSGEVQRGRVLPVRNRSSAQLLGREMEILANDEIYQDALSIAAKLVGE